MQVAAYKLYACLPDLSHTTTNPGPKSHLSNHILPRYMNIDARNSAALPEVDTSNSTLQHKKRTMAQSSTYSQGHHVVTTANHIIRTAEHDAAFLLPYIKPTGSLTSAVDPEASRQDSQSTYPPAPSQVSISHQMSSPKRASTWPASNPRPLRSQT
jgi:hypothetical protein